MPIGILDKSSENVRSFRLIYFPGFMWYEKKHNNTKGAACRKPLLFYIVI